ncbi:MAG: hypothetical protein CMH54_03965 [Myxococcales bacterium]|nr:hypothetical protein [Myxococcales bacterium]
MNEGGKFLILGGAGLVGLQVCRTVARDFSPGTIIVASLLLGEAEATCKELAEEFPDVEFVPEYGNLFVPEDLADAPRSALRDDPANRARILQHTFGDFEQEYKTNKLAGTIKKHRPQVIVDSVNTATGFSYQDVFGTTVRVEELLKDPAIENHDALQREVEVLMMSQGAPQLIRHIRFLYRATVEVGTRVYVKVGTTGTGGMGLNIPYTHSEDRPSSQLLNKTEVAFGHTGLLFLMARTPDAPIVKEIKPAAMIGYRAVQYTEIRGRDGHPQHVFEPRTVNLESEGMLGLREDSEGYVDHGLLQTTVVNTGENGVFTRGEFGAITAIGQMEFVTPEEIARTVALEIRGATTGRDIISALDGAVMEPSYRAGMIRTVAQEDLAALEAKMEDHSVALGQLGPPELSKLLFEAHLIKETFGAERDGILYIDGDRSNPRDPADAAQAIAEICSNHTVRQTATSVGIPILYPDGCTLFRGPRINVPEVRGRDQRVSLEDADAVEGYIRKGWVDLRPANIALWQDRFRRMIEAREHVATKGSAAFTLATYLGQDIEIGEVVAWVLNNEMGGSRLF